MAGVNIENFLAKEEKGVASNVSAEPSVSINQIDAREITQGHANLNLFGSAKPSQTGNENLSLFENVKPSQTGNENLSLFDNAQSSETSFPSTEGDRKNNHDSGWGADFQSAASTTLHKDSKHYLTCSWVPQISLLTWMKYLDWLKTLSTR